MKIQTNRDYSEDMTLIDIFFYNKEKKPDQIAYRIFDNLSCHYEITNCELWVRSAALCQKLLENELSGERVLLITSTIHNYLVAFYACLMAGVVAIPSPPIKRKRLYDRLHLLVSDAQACAFITDSDETLSLSVLSSMKAIDSRINISDKNRLLYQHGWHPPRVLPASLAYLQYTSGSTGDPKGVMVTHANIIANCRIIEVAMSISEISKGLTALPLFHDMGLVGGVIQPLFSGFEMNLISPVWVVQYPELWLQLISRYNVTISGAPNFMFDFVAKSATQDRLHDIDLSSWEVAYCGAEPIRVSTIRLFSERFASLGFRLSSFYPCYGMAEATLFITGAKAGEPPKLDDEYCNMPIVCCGFPRLDTKVELVDPMTHCRIIDGKEGEVWVKGGSVASGYWGRPKLTQEVFRAFLADSNDGPFLRTGDLGIRKGGEFYITGRIKDLIIIRGRNYAPQDIEQIAEQSHEAIQQAGCVAFSIQRDDTELLVVVAQIHRTWLRHLHKQKAIRQSISMAIYEEFQLTVGDIVLVRPYSLPRTSSGKPRRSQSRTQYITGKLLSLPKKGNLKEYKIRTVYKEAKSCN